VLGPKVRCGEPADHLADPLHAHGLNMNDHRLRQGLQAIFC
jgi:hypothetical protein